MAEPARLIPVPGLSEADIGVVTGILENNGLFARMVTHGGDGAPFGEVLVREADLEKVKRALSKYRVRGAGSSMIEIPW